MGISQSESPLDIANLSEKQRFRETARIRLFFNATKG